MNDSSGGDTHAAPSKIRGFAKLGERLLADELRGVHYAVSLFIATTILWLLVQRLGDASPIWAISSMVATSDPLMKEAVNTFRGRIVNTLLGCAIGLLFVVADRSAWELPIAMAVTVLVSSYVVRIPTMWRQAPITAAIVIAGALQAHSEMTGIEVGARRVGEVLAGCIVGLVVSWVLSIVWPLREPSTDRPAKAS